jgi:hypothetical protein
MRPPQGEAVDRNDIDDIYRINVRNASGAMVPIRALADAEIRLDPAYVIRYNNVRAVTINVGEAALAPLLYLALVTVEGQFPTPTLMGKRLEINPFAVFLDRVLRVVVGPAWRLPRGAPANGPLGHPRACVRGGKAGVTRIDVRFRPVRTTTITLAPGSAAR